MLNIPIVIAAYNRREPLKRLLGSLERANYPVEVRLIISIDGSANNSDVHDVADQFEWKHGEKEVIKHGKNLGLRKHIISCGKLSQQYDGIILLEDDLFVAPYFYDYAQDVQSKYSAEVSIAGVALYSHQYNEAALLPFTPITDEYDVFFMQLACSWGQSWLSHQWRVFEEWYTKNSKLALANDASIPQDVRLWPDTSWKKYYIKYIIDANKFFVYPRVSQVTNFGDMGQHHSGTKQFQVPLQLCKKSINLPDFSDSYSKYDSYCEMLPECVKHLSDELSEYDFDVDLYGIKSKNELTAEYVLTTQKTEKPLKSYGRDLKPHEVNVICNIAGDDIALVKREKIEAYSSFEKHRYGFFADFEVTQKYFYAVRDIHYHKLTSAIERKDSEIERLKYGIKPYMMKKYKTVLRNLSSKIYNRINRLIK